MHFIKKILNKKTLLIVLAIAFIASLLPMLYIAKFNYPYRDDFSFSANTYHTIRDTGSVFKGIGTSFEEVKEKYYSWQGTFSSIFLFTLAPNIWGARTYMLTTYIMFAAFILSTLYFSYSLIVRLLKQSIVNWLIISILIMILSIQFVPSPTQSFFWYNGSVYYLFFYCLELFLFGGIISLLAKQKPKIWLYAIACVPLALFIGGGNFVTALNTAIILFLLTAFLIWKRNKKWIITASVLIADVISFSISALAPGNAIRQAFFEQTYSAAGAIFKSFDAGLTFAFTLFDAPKGELGIIVLVLIAVMPLLAKVITNPEYKFKYPAIALLLAFGVFCAQFTPTIYAMGGYGPDRLINIIFFSYIWYLLFALTYIAGWGYRKITEIIGEKETISQWKNTIQPVTKKLGMAALAAVVIVCSALLYTIVDERAHDLPTSFSATRSIITGEAYVYHLQQQERLNKLLSDEKDIKFEPLSVFPEVLFMDDYVNEGIEEYYEKDSVEIIE
jgi:hypothetical protein